MGGLYDWRGDWIPPHVEHRFGVNIDVGKRQVKKSNRKKLIETMCKSGFAVISEGDAPEEVGTYHLEYGITGQEAWGREIRPDTNNSRLTRCCPSTREIPEACILLYDYGKLIVESDIPFDCQ